MNEEKAEQYDRALEALDNMYLIVAREQIVRGFYVDPNEYDKKKAAEGAICGGNKFCAIGSLFVGGGIPVTKSEYDGFDMPEALPTLRNDVIKQNPHLGIALKALNKQAEKYMDKKDISMDDLYTPNLGRNEDDRHDLIEALFEAAKDEADADEWMLDRDDLLKMINKARLSILHKLAKD
jgi:hypothetical protein